MSTTCYLCGELIHGPVSQDHVPPQQVFAQPLRRAVNLSRLITLPTHPACNKSYNLDEEYFVWSLAPLATGTPTADILNGYNASKFRSGRNVPLGRKVLSEFQGRPGGLHLPAGLIVKRIEGARIGRVAWKIVRGLYTHHTGYVLPESTTYAIDIVEVTRHDPSDLDDLWELVKARPGLGTYKGVFDYKYVDLPCESEHLHGWGMLFWTRVVVFIGHLHPPSPHAA